MTTPFPTLNVNLTALRANYHLLRSRHARHSIAAVVKANAYGLGVIAISRTLWDEGCKDFFVATLAEGIELRSVLPEATIGVFQGVFPGEEKDYTYHRLSPVLNDFGQVESFTKIIQENPALPVMIHVDTGMTRLGLSESSLPLLKTKLPTIHHHPALHVISHLACSNTPDHPKNEQQLKKFHNTFTYFPDAKISFANSAGIFLPPTFHFDSARPGCALYGINPVDGENPMQPVATLSAPILQIRTLSSDETVGYGATVTAKKGSRIATVGLGYADGYFRSLGNKGFAYVAEHKIPIIGRVSMDTIMLDVSTVPESKTGENTRAEFINSTQTVDDIARQCDTIGYEIFTHIGNRVQRTYSD